jgi:hypothetical protein
MKVTKVGILKILGVVAVVGLVFFGVVQVNKLIVGNNPSTLLVPGERIGPVSIGMDLVQAGKIVEGYGKFERTDEGGTYNTDVGVGLGVHQFFAVDSSIGKGETPGKVYVILTDDPRFKDKFGLAVGDTTAKFVEKYGKPDNQFPTMLGIVSEWKVGLTVVASFDDDVVHIIAVWPAKK